MSGWLTPPPAPLPERPGTAPQGQIQPVDDISTPTLSDVYSSVRVLQQLSQTLVGQQVEQPKTPGQAISAWVRKNFVWILGMLGGLFMGYQEVRDQWRDGQRDTAEFRERTNKALDDGKLELDLHKLDAKQERAKTRRAIKETQAGTMEGIERIQKEIRIVHPSLERRAPKESDTLRKAKVRAKDAAAEENLFPDVHLPAEN